MYSIDLNTNIAVERQAERVRAIQGYDLPRQSMPVSQSRTSASPAGSYLPTAQWAAALAVALLVISVVLVSSAWM